MPGGGIPYKITSPYEDVMTALEEAATASNSGFVFRKQSLVSCFRRGAAASINFDCYLLLREWRWRPITSNERVEILIHAQEEISEDASRLHRSTVRVSYYLQRENNLSPLHTVHFDYGPTQVCHPAFHAQIAGDPVVLPDLERTELQCELVFPGSPVTCFEGARIPTSDMTLTSVLLCLAADHIGGPFFEEFRTKLRDIQNKMPQPVFDELKESLRVDPNNLRSLHWFAHMPA